MNSNYYNHNAQSFFDGTVNVDMTSLYQKFEPYLFKGAKIIDAGCGSGRDTAYFLNQGYQVEAFDASEQLVKLAEQQTKHPIQHCTFLEFHTLPNSLDGIWACSSLLHVPMNQLQATFMHLSQFLKPNGVLYCSFKYGTTELERNGRHFTDLDEILLNQLLTPLELTIQEQWLTNDLRPGRSAEHWLNAILLKQAGL